MPKRITTQEVQDKLAIKGFELISDFKGVNEKSELRCHCGKHVHLKPACVMYGKRKSCGCSRLPGKHHTRVDRTGERYGKLLVIRWARPGYWLCRCDCGNEKEIDTNVLGANKTRSCGCIRNFRPEFDELPNQYWRHCVHGAEQRGLSFEVSVEYVMDIFKCQGGKCALTGEPLELVRTRYQRNRKKQTASLDRIDSSKGYIEGNVQWVHKCINMMKRSLSDDDFREWCRKVTDHANTISIAA